MSCLNLDVGGALTAQSPRPDSDVHTLGDHPLARRRENDGVNAIEDSMIFRISFITVFVVVLLTSADPLMARKYKIDTAPVKGGQIKIDGAVVGVAPIELELKIREPHTALVEAEKEGAVSYWPLRLNKFDRSKKGRFIVRLEVDESAVDTVKSSIANVWQTVEVRQSLDAEGYIDEDLAWQNIVSAVSDRFDDFEKVNSEKFELQSAWRTRVYPYAVLRHRIVVKSAVSKGRAIKFQLESEAFFRDNPAVPVDPVGFEPYSRVFAKDQDIAELIRTQL